MYVSVSLYAIANVGQARGTYFFLVCHTDGSWGTVVLHAQDGAFPDEAPPKYHLFPCGGLVEAAFMRCGRANRFFVAWHDEPLV